MNPLARDAIVRLDDIDALIRRRSAPAARLWLHDLLRAAGVIRPEEPGFPAGHADCVADGGHVLVRHS